MRCFIRYDTLLGLVLFFLCGCAATASENQDVSSPVQAPPARHAPDRQQESPWEFIYGRYISDTQILEMVSVHGSNPEHPTVLLAFDAGGAGNRVALSHDKQFFAYTRIPQQVSVHTRNAAELWVVNRETRDVRKMTDQVAVGRYTNYPLWSPDDQMIAFYRTTARIPPYEQHIVLIDRETVQETTLISQSVQLQESEGSDFIYPLDWSPDGQYLYYQRGKYGVVTLWRIAADGNHAPEQIGTLSEAGTPRCYHLSANAQHLLCAVQRIDGTSLMHIALDTGQVTALTDEVLPYASDPVWKPAAQSLTVGVPHSEHDDVTTVQTMNLQGVIIGEGTIPTHGEINPCSWSPDDLWLASFAVTDSDEYLVLSNHDGSVVHHIDEAVTHMCIGWIQ